MLLTSQDLHLGPTIVNTAKEGSSRPYLSAAILLDSVGRRACAVDCRETDPAVAHPNCLAGWSEGCSTDSAFAAEVPAFCPPFAAKILAIESAAHRAIRINRNCTLITYETAAVNIIKALCQGGRCYG